MSWKEPIREEIKEELEAVNEHVFDPDSVRPVDHNWVNRGLKWSCEGANHPNHHVYLRKR